MGARASVRSCRFADILDGLSRHPGGVNVGLCDGSTRFISDVIAIATWRALSTTRGSETLDTF